MTEPSRLRRSIASAVAAAVLVPVLVYAATASNAVATVRAQRDGALLAPATPGGANALVAPAAGAPRFAALSETMIRRAIGAQPLDQGVANVAMVRAVRRPPVVAGQVAQDARVAAWMPVVARLGWRDTSAQLNRLYTAARAADIATVLDVGEALLRRQQMVDRITPILAIAETDPQISRSMVARLQRKPEWRNAYLDATNVLVTREQRVARYDLLRELLHRGGRLTEGEVVKNVTALENGGVPELGFALLKAARPGVGGPLNDPDFRRAATISASGATAVPYDWQLLTGQGYSSDAFVEGGRSALEIKWDGRGVPVFARQRTSARPGRYVLDISLSRENLVDLAALQFRFVCDGTVVAFRPSGASAARLTTDRPVPCAYPVLEIVGDVQSSSMARTVLLNALRLRPAA